MSLAFAVGQSWTFVREPTSWLTNRLDLAEALEKWCESVSGGELDRHVQEKWMKVIREDCRGNADLSDVAAIHHMTIARGRLCG